MRKSAGLLVYRWQHQLEVFLVHPGGPFWKDKDAGAWGIPKGEFAEEEEALNAAQREFKEETGQTVTGEFIELAPVKQKGGKMVFAWAVKGKVDADRIVSNTIKIEWPYKSGRWMSVPEVDKGAWFTIEEAKGKINAAQIKLLDELLEKVNDEKAV